MHVITNQALLQSLINIKNDMKLIELAKDRQNKVSIGQVMAGLSSKPENSDLRSSKK